MSRVQPSPDASSSAAYEPPTVEDVAGGDKPLATAPLNQLPTGLTVERNAP